MDELTEGWTCRERSVQGLLFEMYITLLPQKLEGDLMLFLLKLLFLFKNADPVVNAFEFD